MTNSRDDDKVECVGSLVVHAHDIQELSDSTPSKSNLQKRVTAVGTLFVPTEDLQHHEAEDVNAHCSAAASPSGSNKVSSLQKRITQKLTGPAPPDSEADTWAD